MNFLVIEGGGADGLLAAGAVKRLTDQGVQFDGVFGTSIGGAIALGLACEYTASGSWQFAGRRVAEKIAALSKWDLIGLPAWNFFCTGGYFNSRVGGTFKKLFGEYTIQQLRVPCGAAVTDIDETIENCTRVLGNIEYSYNYNVEDIVAMTTNIPGVFKEIIDPCTKHRMFDGGIGANNCISYVCDYAERCFPQEKVTLYVIRLSSWTPSKSLFNGPIGNLYSMFGLARAKCEQLSMKISKMYQKQDHVKCLSFKTEVGLLSFGSNNQKYVDEGYEFAKEENWNG